MYYLGNEIKMKNENGERKFKDLLLEVDGCFCGFKPVIDLSVPG
jgi:hypothetical protein